MVGCVRGAAESIEWREALYWNGSCKDCGCGSEEDCVSWLASVFISVEPCSRLASCIARRLSKTKHRRAGGGGFRKHE